MAFNLLNSSALQLARIFCIFVNWALEVLLLSSDDALAFDFERSPFSSSSPSSGDWFPLDPLKFSSVPDETFGVFACFVVGFVADAAECLCAKGFDEAEEEDDADDEELLLL